jgi:hypothetical protein
VKRAAGSRRLEAEVVGVRGRRPAVLITATVLALSFLPAVPAAAAASCAGLAATITGTSGDGDRWHRRRRRDPRAGVTTESVPTVRDTICGGKGDDDLQGGAGTMRWSAVPGWTMPGRVHRRCEHAAGARGLGRRS